MIELSGFAALYIFMLAAFTSITTVLSLLNLSLVARLDDRVHGYGSLLGRIWGPVAERLMDFGVGLFLTGVLGGNMIVIHGRARKQSEQGQNRTRKDMEQKPPNQTK